MLPDETNVEEVTPPVEDSPPPPMTTDDMLRQIIEEQARSRQENVDLRAEIAKSRAPSSPAPPANAPSAEQLAMNRQLEIAAFEFYCPGCGRLYHRERECLGSGEAPHPAIEVVSTKEITGDNASDATLHTAAPGVRP